MQRLLLAMGQLTDIFGQFLGVPFSPFYFLRNMLMFLAFFMCLDNFLWALGMNMAWIWTIHSLSSLSFTSWYAGIISIADNGEIVERQDKPRLPRVVRIFYNLAILKGTWTFAIIYIIAKVLFSCLVWKTGGVDGNIGINWWNSWTLSDLPVMCQPRVTCELVAWHG